MSESSMKSLRTDRLHNGAMEPKALDTEASVGMVIVPLTGRILTVDLVVAMAATTTLLRLTLQVES
jgi:hypothetical protein